jgi:subtilisin family serine protease
VAKDANIIAIQVFSQFNSASDCDSEPAPCAKSFVMDQILGLERVAALAGSFNIASVNMSLGGGKFFAYCDATESSRKAIIDNLRSLGIATVIASSNDGYSDAIGAPACISTAVSVGSTGDGSRGSTRDVVSSFSDSASILSLLAPGQWINSSIPGGGYANFSGTSMAAPHVAGAWAILKSKAPSASVDQILSALTSTGIPIFDSRNGITKSRIQVDAALNALGGGGGGGGEGRYSSGTLVTLTANPNQGFAFVKWQRDGADFSSSPVVSVQMSANHSMTAVFRNVNNAAPVISFSTFDGKKSMRINGNGFGTFPRVIINGADSSDFITGGSDALITLKGKRKKLHLRTGSNTVQVVGPSGTLSNSFVLNL